MKLGLSSRVQMHTSDHMNLSNRLRVRPAANACNHTGCNYAEGSAADAGEDFGSGNRTTSTRM